MHQKKISLLKKFYRIIPWLNHDIGCIVSWIQWNIFFKMPLSKRIEYVIFSPKNSNQTQVWWWMDLRKRLRPKGLISSNAILFQQNLRSIQILISHKKIILQGQTHDTSFQNDHTGRKIMFLSYSSLQCYIYVAKKCCSFFDACILWVVFSSFFITFKTFFSRFLSVTFTFSSDGLWFYIVCAVHL